MDISDESIKRMLNIAKEYTQNNVFVNNVFPNNYTEEELAVFQTGKLF